MQVPTIMFCALLVATAPPRASAAVVTVPNCLVSLIDEAQVPAQESGVLVELKVREGQQVKLGELLARIDDAHAQMQCKAAGFKLEVAEARANNDTNIEYAKAASQVALAEYHQGREANQKVAGTVPQAEMRRLALTYERTRWEIKQATVDKQIAGLEAKVSQAEVDAAAENLQRRRICSPLDAVVVELYCHAGEWVQPGDPVMHVVRVDRLRIEGFLNAGEIAPGEVDGKPVTVTVELARSRRETFPGKVVFVSPLVRAGGEFQVWAEVTNRKQHGHWLLRPGLEAEMRIRMKDEG